MNAVRIGERIAAHDWLNIPEPTSPPAETPADLDESRRIDEWGAALDMRRPSGLNDAQYDRVADRVLQELDIGSAVEWTTPEPGMWLAVGVRAGQPWGIVLRDGRISSRSDFARWAVDAGAVKAPELVPKTFGRHITAILEDKSEVRWIAGLEDVLEHAVIAIAAGPEGHYKSAWCRQIGVQAAMRGTPFYYLDGEPAGLDRSFDAMLRTFAPGVDPSTLPIWANRKRMNLATREGIAQLRAELDAVNFRGGIVVADTFAKFAPGLDMDNNVAVSAWLSAMRFVCEECDSTLLVVGHTGHTDKKRVKGASSFVQDTDAAYVFAKSPSGELSITRDRFKSAPSMAPLHYQPRIVDLGRVDKRGKPVTGLVLDVSAQRPAVTGKKLPAEGTQIRRVHDAAIAIIRRNGFASVADVHAAAVQLWTREPGKKDRRSSNAKKYIDDLLARSLLHAHHDGTVLSEHGLLPEELES